MMYRWVAVLVVAGTLAGHPAPTEAALVIRVEDAAIRTEGNFMPGGGWNIWGNGRVGQSVRVAAAGKYQIIVRAWGSPAAGVWPEMALLVDGRAVKTVTVGGTQRADYRFDVDLAAGIHEIAAAFLNDAVIGKEDRNLYLDRFTISSAARGGRTGPCQQTGTGRGSGKTRTGDRRRHASGHREEPQGRR